MALQSKGTVFFFSAEKFTGYSLTRFGHFLFFFSGFVFFFPRKSLQATHSTEKIQPAKKGKKKAKNGIFCRFLVFPLFFFSGQKLFFFSQEKFTRHSLTRFQRAEKKTASEKKTAFSLTHSKNHKKVQILNFSGEKKNTVPLLLRNF